MEDIDVGMPDASATLNRQDNDDANTEDDSNADENESGDGEGKQRKKKGSSGGGITLSGLLNAIVRPFGLTGGGVS